MRRIFLANKKLWEYIFIMFIILAIATLMIINQNNYNDISRNAGYSIGTILKYTERKTKHDFSGGRSITKTIPAYIEYSYHFKDTILYNYYSENSFHIPEDSVKAGERYLVAYQKNKPQKSMVLFDKPIRDSSDFKRYLLDLKSKN